jgi:hypothetical protein
MENGYSICLNKWALDKKITNELGLLLIISSLSAKTGYCYATNDFLAKQFNTTIWTISKKITKLKELGYIKVDYEMVGKEIKQRNIVLLDMTTPIVEMSNTPCRNEQYPLVENAKDNNINNNIINKKENIKEKSDYFDNQELNNAFIEWLEYKKEKHQSYKEKGLTALINKINKDLKEYSIDDIIDGIHNSIANNYQGLFYKKSITTNKKSSPTPSWLNMDLSSDNKNGEEFDLDEYLRTKGIE